jgi:hypothetical protein
MVVAGNNTSQLSRLVVAIREGRVSKSGRKVSCVQLMSFICGGQEVVSHTCFHNVLSLFRCTLIWTTKNPHPRSHDTECILYDSPTTRVAVVVGMPRFIEMDTCDKEIKQI